MSKKWFKKRNTETLDVDEVLFDSFKISSKSFKWEHRLEAVIDSKVFRFLWILTLVLIVFFAGRVTWLIVFNGEDLQRVARGNFVKEVWQRSARGIIYSAGLKPLVSNKSTFNLVLIPAELPQDIASHEVIIDFLEDTFKTLVFIFVYFLEISFSHFTPKNIVFTDK